MAMALVPRFNTDIVARRWVLTKSDNEYNQISAMVQDRSGVWRERAKWFLRPTMKSSVSSRGRRDWANVPPVDCQTFRHMTANGSLMFQSFAARSGEPYVTLGEIEDFVGVRVNYDDSTFRVLLAKESSLTTPAKAESLPLLPVVTAATSGAMTRISAMASDVYNAIWSQLGLASSVVPLLSSFGRIVQSLTTRKNTEARKVRDGSRRGYQFSPCQMLATVRICDQLLDMSELRNVVEQALLLSTDDLLSEHLLAQQICVPSSSTIYRQRLTIDLCTMIYSRRHVFNSCGNWIVHIRADASPQFGKEYFVVEIDRIGLANVGESTTISAMKSFVSRRLLPLQLLGQKASKAEHKVCRLLMALSADCESTEVTLSRAYSIAFDMGVESKLFVAPACGNDSAGMRVLPIQDQDGDGQANDDLDEVNRLCPRALPLGDADHAMHHCMLELKSAFGHWDSFHCALNSVAKYFGNWQRLNRFRATCILRNERFTSIQVRESFASMFKSTCPSLMEHRWEYL